MIYWLSKGVAWDETKWNEGYKLDRDKIKDNRIDSSLCFRWSDIS